MLPNALIRLPVSSSWYLASSNPSPQVQNTFQQAVAKLKQRLTSNPAARLRSATLHATRLQDIVDEVAAAQAVYAQLKSGSKLRTLIVSFSKRVAHYGKVLDALVQHHPEYVSLAWGSMKLIFGAIVEHERIGVTIVTALDDIGEALSRIEFAESLYPTDKMKDTIIALNCHIITFLCRALDWYESSSVSRAIQSITRPVTLRYSDIIEDISKTLGKVIDLSVAGSQAEQRDIHREIRTEQQAQQDFRSVVQKQLDVILTQLSALIQQKHRDGDLKSIHQQITALTSLVNQLSINQTNQEQTLLQELVLMKQDIRSTQTTIIHQLTTIQLNQALMQITIKCAIDSQSSYDQALVFRKIHRTSSSAKSAPFWISTHLHTWNQSPTHATITLPATFTNRLAIRDFYTNVIEQLLGARIPVLWLIQQRTQKFDAREALKSLVAQSMSACSAVHTDIAMALCVRAFDAASSVDEYALLLAENLSRMVLVYLIVDADALTVESREECRRVLERVGTVVAARSPSSVVKVLIVGQGLRREGGGANRSERTVIRINQISKKKGKRVPRTPLRITAGV